MKDITSLKPGQRTAYHGPSSAVLRLAERDRTFVLTQAYRAGGYVYYVNRISEGAADRLDKLAMGEPLRDAFRGGVN